MSDIFDNAISAIQSGLEDFGSNTPKRSLSAVRNLFSGILLLAKEALCSIVPNAAPDVVLAEKFKLIPDGTGGIKFERQGQSTIDVQRIFERFKSLDYPLPEPLKRTLTEIQDLRNDIEHRHTALSHETVKGVIAKGFPVVLYFLSMLDENPPDVLAESYDVMVKISDAYALEKVRCMATFKDVIFPFDVLKNEPFHCDDCQSELVELINSSTDHRTIVCRCNLCYKEREAGVSIELAVKHKYSYRSFQTGESLPETCTSCRLKTYLVHLGCVFCEEKLGDCARCGTPLTPDSTDFDNESVCDYCGHMMSKY